ncbi:SDR family NAD(P)-dependent oxidoreductase [Streptomyces sp. bgisy031]|uniref:SDR family NAD(P)-dependent oxidoreductase n=1 Tax=Streptomyces sp. bgisy031 TaxID=3413772 RepID=UPI003D73C22C
MVERVALITGGAGAVARAIAARFTARGVRVALADLDGAAAKSAAEELPGDVRGLTMDVTDQESVAAAVAALVDSWGRIDVLVNNAGLLVREDGWDMDPDTFDRIVEVNFKGPFLVTRAVVPVMKEQRYGRLVAITSRNSIAGGMPAYGGSKAALDALSVSWARELGPWNITSNAVAPSPIQVTPGLGVLRMTPEQQWERSSAYIQRTPLQRLATRDDVAAAVAYFASEDAGFVTGETLYVAGGSQLAPVSRYPDAVAFSQRSGA